jgi:hypothetical protein
MRAPLVALALLTACAGAAPVPVVPQAPPPDPVTWQGTITYEARRPTPRGASQTRTRHPARFVRVQMKDATGAVLGETFADELGRFALEADRNAAHALVVVASLDHDGHVLDVARDGGGTRPHEIAVPVPDPNVPVELNVTDEHVGAGALHILDMLLLGVQRVKEWTGETLPPFFSYWDRGVTTNWSFYFGARGELRGRTRYGIELLGGEPNRQTTTDTDEHDAMIVLHELGHFVMDVLSSDSSHGGSHPRGALIDPGLAWEEGRATWFATMVLRSPHYQDTIGIEPMGSLRVDHDLERGDRNDVRGMGSESSVGEVLWDLADGADGVPDADQDPIALGPAAVLRAMMELGRQPGSFPALPTFLRHLVKRELVPTSALTELLARGGHAPTLLPENDRSPWPIDVRLPGSASAKIDGVTDPAPSGGPNRPSNGIDAVHTYRVEITEPGWLAATLTIFGTGRASDRSDLDLELRDIRSELLDRSAGEQPVESVAHAVEPGFYVIYVRDGGNGNRAGYELKVERR